MIMDQFSIHNIIEAKQKTRNMQQIEKKLPYFFQPNKNHQDQRKKRQFIPTQLLMEYPLDLHNLDQTFYRINTRISQQQYVMIKMGWRVLTLKRQQQDLALLCCGILQSQLIFPIKIYTMFRSSENQPTLRFYSQKQLWMQTQIMVTPLSHQQNNDTIQLKAYRLGQQLTQHTRTFIQKHITWDIIINPQFQQSIILDNFQETVVKTAKEMIRNFKFSTKE